MAVYKNYQVTLSPKGAFYRIESFWEEKAVYISVKDVEEICQDENEKELAAILLGIIGMAKEDARGSRRNLSHKENISYEVEFDAINILLEKYELFQILEVFEGLKWPEMREIFTSSEIFPEFEEFR